MKKLILALALCVTVLTSCKVSPTGDGKKDADFFAKKMASCYKKKDVVKMRVTINYFYNYYKKQPASKVKKFVDSIEEEVKYGDLKNVDSEKFEAMLQAADNHNRMDKLFEKAKRAK
ncbi:MAG: hypothetical protein IJM81_05800 [Prevotella sp.]|nr:hypothetical protein [Prevotella sp.]